MTAPDAQPTNASTEYIDAGELHVYYHDQGSGAPLVLLHGGLATTELMWGDRIATLAQRYRVLAPDTRGHGRTDNPAGRLSYDQMADDVAAFVGALGLEQPLVLGYSDGAQIGIELGLRHPNLAKALVLGGAVTRPTPVYLESLRGMGIEQPGRFDAERFAEQYPEFWDSLKTAHQVYGPEYLPDFLSQIADLWINVPDYGDEQLAGIATPTLVICGDRDKASLDESLRLYRLLPRAELAVIPNADHGAADGELFWQAVDDFLSRQV